MLGMTQQQLCDRVGIKFQQIRKFETGTSRISVSLIRHIAAALEVPVTIFFEGLDGQVPGTGKAGVDILTDKEALELANAGYAIPENQRKFQST
jgi:transcriptional regulator with XRE-family HTH domain